MKMNTSSGGGIAGGGMSRYQNNGDANETMQNPRLLQNQNDQCAVTSLAPAYVEEEPSVSLMKNSFHITTRRNCRRVTERRLKGQKKRGTGVNTVASYSEMSDYVLEDFMLLNTFKPLVYSFNAPYSSNASKDYPSAVGFLISEYLLTAISGINMQQKCFGWELRGGLGYQSFGLASIDSSTREETSGQSYSSSTVATFID
ncbi:hypothetical protein DICVIV_13847 [Dictyocaulus viviparus]|uniref:Uncharacterized protein n=1 Tax=Dictyocaulus viviparus TaxID=29172 RepID=A0A0D8X8Z4_DICVI|nr:hypothetical protein DICVIV_13847 [Dictyocaulus viviparus]